MCRLTASSKSKDSLSGARLRTKHHSVANGVELVIIFIIELNNFPALRVFDFEGSLFIYPLSIHIIIQIFCFEFRTYVVSQSEFVICKLAIIIDF